MNIYPARGFTILELLVVVTIMVILLTLLTPALDNVMFQAHHVKCLTNLRGIGQAQSLYLQDNRQTYPPDHNLEHADREKWNAQRIRRSEPVQRCVRQPRKRQPAPAQYLHGL
jgi:prepilin-type N-terminal cleavage/methylation domain-containing protein